MPNTLAHLAVQGLATRTVVRGVDPKWVFVGAVIPDAPWIVQRVLNVMTELDPYQVRLYAVVQASFVSCVVFSMALACIAVRPLRTLGVLSLGSLLHLLLDALQTKWANGVHLFAPFDWGLLNWGVFWPESPMTWVVTAAGLLYVAMTFTRAISQSTGLHFTTPRVAGFAVLTATYMLVPFGWMDAAEQTDNHFVKTLQLRDRTGQTIAIDRERYTPEDHTIATLSGEQITLEGVAFNAPAEVSIKGRFISNQLIRMKEVHVHHGWFREAASLLGLGLVTLVWAISAWREMHRRNISGDRIRQSAV